MPRIPPSTKQGLLVSSVVLLTSIFFASLIAVAASDWRAIGTTAGGDEVFVSSLSAPKNGLRIAWIRVDFKEPLRLAQGGPFVELRARVRYNCLKGSAAPNSEWLYSRDRGKLVVSKKTRQDDQFGTQSEGGFGQIARDYVCQQK